MKKRSFHPSVLALLAAALFGASTPLSKLLLGQVQPIALTAFLYLGSGFGLLLLRIATRSLPGLRERPERAERAIGRKDIPWLVGMVAAGGVAAPILLMFCLRGTSAAVASMLLNFEGVATTVIAAFVFQEAVGRRVWMAIAGITLACGLLSWNPGGSWTLSLGAVGVLLTCVLWGFDNNFSNRLSSRDPVAVVTIKSLAAGSVSLVLALLAGESLPTGLAFLYALLLGVLSYGTSIVLLVRSMRDLGAARASGIFCVAPFVGTFLSLLVFRESPGLLFYLSVPVMLLGVRLIAGDGHTWRRP